MVWCNPAFWMKTWRLMCMQHARKFLKGPHVLSPKAGYDPSKPFPFATTPRRLPAYPLGSSSQCQPPASADICWFEWPRNLLKKTPSSFDLKICTQFSGKNPMKYSPSRAELAHSRALLRCPRRSSVTNYELTPPMCRLQLSKLLLCSHIFHNLKALPECLPRSCSKPEPTGCRKESSVSLAAKQCFRKLKQNMRRWYPQQQGGLHL